MAKRSAGRDRAVGKRLEEAVGVERGRARGGPEAAEQRSTRSLPRDDGDDARARVLEEAPRAVGIAAVRANDGSRHLGVDELVGLDPALRLIRGSTSCHPHRAPPRGLRCVALKCGTRRASVHHLTGRRATAHRNVVDAATEDHGESDGGGREEEGPYSAPPEGKPQRHTVGPVGGRKRSTAAVMPGIAARNAAATRAPRMCMMLRRLRIVGRRTNQPTPAPQAHPSRRARANPE